MASPIRIFLSHSHDDKVIADTLADLLRGVFGDSIELRYSSANDNGEGITPGEPWLNWILEQVKLSNITLILLTPQSWQKPWVLWESGAVAGVGLMSGDRASVVPVAFKISLEQVPSPLKSLQAIYGNDETPVRRLLDKIRSLCGEGPTSDDEFYDFKVGQQLDTYIQNVDGALADRPMDLTEGAVVDWISRLESFDTGDRASEIEHLHKAIEIAFVPAGTVAAETSLDVRLHRRLGELYLKAKKPAQAIQQFDLALKASPRDIFLLHKKGLAQLDAINLPGAEETLGEIEKLDSMLASENAEIGGLQGRVYRKKWEESGDIEDLRRARDGNAVVAKSKPESYWMHDTVGQYSLLLGEKDRASEAFEAALNAVDKIAEKNVWSQATQATAFLGMERDEEGEAALRLVAVSKPTSQEKSSIIGGLERVAKGRKVGDDVLKRWIALLDDPS